MTHTLHREGSIESLLDDFPMLFTPAQNVNEEGALEKLQEIIKIIAEEEPTNIGSYEVSNIYDGCSIEDISENLKKARIPVLRCCINGKEKVKNILRKVKQRNFGLSVAVTGVFDEVVDIAHEEGLKPHSVHLSLGVWGKRDKLPPSEIRAITTMCGHGMLSPFLVKKEIEMVQNGKKTIEEAAKTITRPCTCGVVNYERVKELLSQYAKENKEFDF